MAELGKVTVPLRVEYRPPQFIAFPVSGDLEMIVALDAIESVAPIKGTTVLAKLRTRSGEDHLLRASYDQVIARIREVLDGPAQAQEAEPASGQAAP